MSETTYYIKQVWRQKGDALFDRIPFKEENKAQDLSQTTRPVLLLETKTNGGSGAIFAVGRVTEPTVVEQAIDYPNGEFPYHIPFAYDFILEDKKQGLTREELQEMTGQKFAPQARGGLYAIEESVYEQVVAILKERAAGQAPAVEKAPVAAPAAKASAKASSAVKASLQTGVADSLAAVQHLLNERADLRIVIDGTSVHPYPAELLGDGTDLVSVQETITQYVQSGSNTELEQASQEIASTTAAAHAPRYAKLIGLVERLVREGKYDTVQSPTVQKAFYREAKLPHPYLSIELQGKQGHHVLGADGTLYTAEGKTVQHFLGL